MTANDFVDSLFTEDILPQDLPSLSSSSTSSAANCPSGSDSSSSSWKFTISSRTLYILGAIVVLGILIWMYRSYHQPRYMIPDRMTPRAYEHPHPIIPPIQERPDPAPAIASPNVLLELEKELTYNYAQFQETLKTHPQDMPSLQNWVNSIVALYSKMKIEIDRLIPTIQDPQIQQQLQKGLTDAELLMSQAQNALAEKKRMASSTEADQESLNVLKNMHYMGLGNKIKNNKGANIAP